MALALGLWSGWLGVGRQLSGVGSYARPHHVHDSSKTHPKLQAATKQPAVAQSASGDGGTDSVSVCPPLGCLAAQQVPRASYGHSCWT